MLLRFFLLVLIWPISGYEKRTKTVYSHRDNIAAPILAYPDDRSCNERCQYKYPGGSKTPYCCGRGDTAGTYFCCQYSTCCSRSYCCAPGYQCSDDGEMCTSSASKRRSANPIATIIMFLAILAVIELIY